MRRVIVALMSFALLLATGWAPSRAAPLGPGALGSRDAVLAWMNTYRVTHDLAHVPDAVHALSKLVVLKDPETSGAFVGFLAGVLAANPDRAEQIVGKMFSLPPEDQWIDRPGDRLFGAAGMEGPDAEVLPTACRRAD